MERLSILHINYFFPPIINPRSIRWRNFTKYFKEQGHRIDVLTVNPCSGYGAYVEGTESEIPSGVRVHRTYPGLIHHLRFGIISKGNKTSSTGKCDIAGSRHATRISLIRRGLYFIWRAFVRDLLIPDQYADWLPIGCHVGRRLIRSNGYSVLISSGMPFTDHVVAYYLKRRFPSLIWIAEYGDPWSLYSYPPRGKLSQYLHDTLERTILKKADAVVVMTDETRNGFLRKFPFLADGQVMTIPHGCDTQAIEALPSLPRSRFTLGYIGKFDFIRDPSALFQALKNVSDNKIDYDYINVGTIQDYYKNIAYAMGLNDNVTFLANKAHLDALQIAKSCDVLLYWGNISPFQMPSKLYEYLALRKPILCVVADDNSVNVDIGAKIIRKYNRGIIVTRTPDRIADAIITMLKLWKSGTYEQVFNLAGHVEVDWRTRAQAFNDVILRIHKEKCNY